MASGDYARIRHGFWTDPDVRRLDAEQKVLLLYYFSSPHSNMVGLYHCPTFYAALETGVSEEKVVAALANQLKPFVVYDPRTAEVWVKKAARHQVANVLSKDDKRRKKVVGMVGETHSSWLLAQFLTAYTDWQLGIPIPTGVEPPPELSTDAEGACEAPSKGLVHSIAYHSSSEDKSSGGEPPLKEPDEEPFHTAVVMRVKDWPKPPPDEGLGTEVSIAQKLVKNLDRDVVLRLVEMAPLLQRTEQPSLRIWYSKTNRGALSEAVGEVRKDMARRAPKETGASLSEILSRAGHHASPN